MAYSAHSPYAHAVYPRRTAARHRRRKTSPLAGFLALVFALCLLCLSLWHLYTRGAPVHLSAGQGPAVMLETAPVYQNPELPNGCEATSLSALLQYHGFPADKSLLAYGYIPRQDFTASGDTRYGPDPHKAYAGDPGAAGGFYCFAGPVAAGANQYLEEQGSALRCKDISGSTAKDWLGYLKAGSPVMLWVTLDYGSTAEYASYQWLLPDGSTYTPYKNLHCLLLTGYDDNLFYLCDPLIGNTSLPRQALYDSYLCLGAQAAVIQ